MTCKKRSISTSLSKALPHKISHVTSLNATRILNCIPNVFLDQSTSRLEAVTILKDGNQTFEQLVAKLEPLALAEAPDTPLLVIFVTRSLAAEVYSRPDLLTAAIGKLAGPHATYCTSVQTLVAVVDKLPCPAADNASSAYSGYQDAGAEGICVASSSSKHFGMSSDYAGNWSQQSSRFTHSLEPDKPATVTCLIAPRHHEVLDKVFSDPTRKTTKAVETYSVQVPLPSTIFENGQRHTLLFGQHSRHSDSATWTTDSSRSVQHAQFALPFSLDVDSQQRASLRLPLVKLTDAFRVKACRGNIVRRVQSIRDGDSAVRPASEGLESAVSKYFVDKGVRPHALSVWALIVPMGSQANEQIAETLKATPTQPLADPPPWIGKGLQPLQDLINNGATLRKVTSGGGGWGNKAGLLALDPDTSFDGKPALAEEHLASKGFQDDVLLDGLPPIAQEGDLIQFLLCPPEVLEGPEEGVQANASGTQSAALTGAFGVIPSTIDELYNPQSASDAPSIESIVHRNWFGALSEKGVSTQSRSFSGWEDKLVSRTRESKIDVPFATLALHKTKSSV